MQPSKPPGRRTSGPGAWALWICYLPILAWGPLLAVVTRAYHLRRTR
ncbi:hypothetical protein ACIRPK_27880 [Kitasatospora sp. NPDC101801]